MAIFDRCYTPGDNMYGQSYGAKTRKETSEICTAKGGVVPSVRQYTDAEYWMWGLYGVMTGSYGGPWNYDVWVGLNHFTCK